MGQQLANILYNQANKFLHQVNDLLSPVMEIFCRFARWCDKEIKVLVFFIQLQTFEDLLKGKKLKPFEQMKVRTSNRSLNRLKATSYPN